MGQGEKEITWVVQVDVSRLVGPSWIVGWLYLNTFCSLFVDICSIICVRFILHANQGKWTVEMMICQFGVVINGQDLL